MKRLLVCEDEDTIREFVVINLKRAGYDVVDVSSGEAALRVFEQENGIILLWGSELDLDDVVGLCAVGGGELEDYCSFDK